jgi:hypothetical protein
MRPKMDYIKLHTEINFRPPKLKEPYIKPPLSRFALHKISNMVKYYSNGNPFGPEYFLCFRTCFHSMGPISIVTKSVV